MGANKIVHALSKAPQRKNKGNPRRQFWRPLSKKHHLDLFPDTQNTVWTQKREIAKAPHKEKHSNLSVLMRKPKIANFDDPYHGNSTLQVPESDIVSIGYWKKCNFVREGCSKLKKHVFSVGKTSQTRNVKTVVNYLGKSHFSGRPALFLMGNKKVKWPFWTCKNRKS